MCLLDEILIFSTHIFCEQSGALLLISCVPSSLAETSRDCLSRNLSNLETCSCNCTCASFSVELHSSS